MTRAKTVLVPLDGSLHATTAVPVARELGELYHATVVVFHVTDDALASAALVDRMSLSSEDVRGLVVERSPGAAAVAIVREAAEREAALIVMCPRTRTDRGARILAPWPKQFFARLHAPSSSFLQLAAADIGPSAGCCCRMMERRRALR